MMTIDRKNDPRDHARGLARTSRWLPSLALGLTLGLAIAACSSFTSNQPPAPPAPQAKAEERIAFNATAYSIEGKTAVGTTVREGVVAADPKVLPMGSRIRVEDAGSYSGEYVVKDTGRKIDGHELDIYLANDGEAKKFGKKKVQVVVLQYGDGTRDQARREPMPVDEAKAPALR